MSLIESCTGTDVTDFGGYIGTASEEQRGTDLGPHRQCDAASYSSYVGNVVRENVCRLDAVELAQTLVYYGRWCMRDFTIGGIEPCR